MVPLCRLHPRGAHVHLVHRRLFLGHVSVYTDRQGMATHEAGSLHQLHTVPLGQCNLKHRSGLYDSVVTSGTSVEPSNEHGPKVSGALILLTRVAVSILSWGSRAMICGQCTDHLQGEYLEHLARSPDQDCGHGKYIRLVTLYHPHFVNFLLRRRLHKSADKIYSNHFRRLHLDLRRAPRGCSIRLSTVPGQCLRAETSEGAQKRVLFRQQDDVVFATPFADRP